MRFLVFGMLLGAIGAASLAGAEVKASGHWEGKIQLPNRELSFSVDLDRNAKDAWIGSMTVTGSTSTEVPLNTVAVEGEAVRFTVNLPEEATFEGKLSADGAKLSGTASNSQGQAPFELTRAGEAKVKLPPPSTALSKEFAGLWEGSIDAGGKTLHVQLKLAAAADGTATGSMISVDQGNVEIPVTTVAIHEKELQLDVRAVSGKYHGTLDSTGQIAGEWSQGGNTIPLAFKRAQ